MEKDEEKLFARKRMEKWIKIFLIFLAFVWLCTIISKSIYVSGLPLVKTDTATKKVCGTYCGDRWNCDRRRRSCCEYASGITSG